MKNKLKILLHRWLNYEYWPTTLMYALIFPYLTYLAIRTRSFVYFTNVNPMLPDGGMYQYDKSVINSLIPSKYRPASIVYQVGGQLPSHMVFPVICKPVKGERGKGVVKIEDKEQLDRHLTSCSHDQIIETFIDLPNEAGVFFVKLPGQIGNVTSVTTKMFLTVTGDGVSTIRTLMAKDMRALMQRHRFSDKILDDIPPYDSQYVLEPIGNHNRGTKFINSNRLISPPLKDVFCEVANAIEGFNYGRFDIKYDTWDDVLRGDFVIMELNGVNSEPTHIYDQSTGLFSALRDMYRHWSYIGQISMAQRKAGYPPMSLFEFYQHCMIPHHIPNANNKTYSLA